MLIDISFEYSMLESATTRDALLKISRHGQDVMNQIEQSKKPVVAAVAGSCLGGGFEVGDRYLHCFYSLDILLGCIGMSLSYCNE